MKVIIVDDEAPSRAELRKLLSIHPAVEVAGEASGVAEALELSAAVRPDLVFLDVQLRGESGFDFVGRAPVPAPGIVFVTAHDRYAVRGFECEAIDYLLKPVHPARLAESLRRMERRVPSPSVAPAPPPRARAGDLVFLKTDHGARFVPWKDIRVITTEGNYTRVTLTQGDAGLMLRPLKDWQDLAPEGRFIQLRRTSLVDPTWIREIQINGPSEREALLADGAKLPVGPSYWPAVKAALKLA